MQKVQNVGVDVIVRLHSIARRRELARAVFSIYGQEYRPLRIILALQRMSDDDEALLRSELTPILELPDAPDLVVAHYRDAVPTDARSVLVNLAFEHLQGRYVGFLDYDDVLYPEAYRMLTERLSTSDAAIAFGGIIVKAVDVYDTHIHASSQSLPFVGESLRDLFRSNFCPVHSFLIDRLRTPSKLFRFEDYLTIEEDYEFLIRVCTSVRSDFSLANKYIGEYYYKLDNSNTLSKFGELSAEEHSRVRAAANFVSGRRSIAILSEDVQDQLGLEDYDPNLTVMNFLDKRD